MRVIFAPQAERDLEAIGDWIARDDPDAAVRFLFLLAEKAREIGEMPLASPAARELPNHNLRQRSVRGYVILYRATRDAVRIARVVHGRRDYPTLFRTP